MAKLTAKLKAVLAASPEVFVPPAALPVLGDRIQGLTVRILGRDWLIGPSIQGDPETEQTVETAAAVTMELVDVEDRLDKVLEGLQDGAQCLMVLDTVEYVLLSADYAENVWSLVFEDEVANRLRSHRGFKAVSRDKVTRAGFMGLLCDEAGQSPAPYIRRYTPELLDKQPVRDPPVEDL